MKLYDGGRAPNPRRVRIFLAEKGIALPPLEPVDIGKMEHRTDAFTAMNPTRTIPVLVLDDGTAISESVAICRYFEELHREPPLFGRNTTDKAIIEMWQRRIELGLYECVAASFRHAHPAMADRETPQVPAWAERCRAKVPEHLRLLDSQLSRHTFVTGETYTIADITAQVAIDFMRLPKILVPDDCLNLKRWHAAVSARPSAGA
jgi:glutathione S-transferase